MAQNITLLGASYSAVPAVTLPKTGGGTAQFDDTTDADATASDILQGKTAYVNGVKLTGTGSGGGGITVEALSVTQNGTYTAPTGKAYSPVTVNVSGGASNVITGTFKGTTTGQQLSIPLNYTGSGYPVVIAIYPSEGAYNSSGTFYALIQRYALCYFFAIKSDMTTSPVESSSGDYSSSSNSRNTYSIVARYKSSTSNATSLSNTSDNAYQTAGGAAASTIKANVIMTSKNKLAVWIASSGGYGFAANIEYTYRIIYSS